MRIYFNEDDLIKSENPDEVIKDFEFNMDVEFDKSGDDWKIKGLASTEHVDQQGEVVKMSGLDITPLQTGKGIFNYDHQKGPENILGVIENAEIKKDGLHVEGYLLKNCDRAKHIYNILESLKPKDKKRLGLSVEGKVLKRSLDGKTIAAARIDKVALTLDPVNPYTYAEFAKSLEAIETDLNKPIVDYVKVDIAENDSKLPDYEVISNPDGTSVTLQVTNVEDNHYDYSFTKDELKEIIEYTVNNTIDKTLEIYNDIQKSFDIDEDIDEDIEKGGKGEGSRGGKIIGHTKSGKAIYDSAQKTHKYTLQDHIDAKKRLANKRLDLISQLDGYGLNLPSEEAEDRMNSEIDHLEYAIGWHNTKIKKLSAQKSLTAGDYNVAPSQRTQGAALAKESLHGKKKKKLKDKIKSLVEQELEKLTKDKKE